MRVLLNILWIIFGGFFSWIMWIFFGLLWCITIIGIPIGVQCFKLANISLNPFGKEIVYNDNGGLSFLLNILWFLFGGLEMALGNLIMGLILCITIIGIPFGKQFFKIARLAMEPFGAEVERVHVF